MAELGMRIAEARGRAGVTQENLAAAAGLDRAALAKIETGRRRVGAIELSRIADALDERYEWFFEEPPAAVVSHRNTKEPGVAERSIDRLIERVARHVEFVQAAGALTLTDIEPLPLPATAKDVEPAAVKARALLDLNDREPAQNLQQRVARAGLMAFSLGDVGKDGADAASILLERGGIAIVNGNLQPGRRRLALAHEFGHFVFADEYSVDFDVAQHGDDERWEAQLDRFARAVLLPSSGLRDRWTQEVGRHGEIRAAAIFLGSEFRVDMTTLARRLTDLGLVDAAAANEVRRARTTRADIVEMGLVVSEELTSPGLPAEYERAVLRMYREDDVSADRALELLLDTWTVEQLPVPALRPAQALWEFL